MVVPNAAGASMGPDFNRTATPGRPRRGRRARRLAAVATAGAAMLIPAALAGTGAAVLPVSNTTALANQAPGLGDVLGLLGLRAADTEESLGASGRLPEADSVSPELIAALQDPNRLQNDAGALSNLPSGPLGIPGVMLEAYLKAQQTLGVTTPGCGLHWSVLAGIGRIESNHARGGKVDTKGTTVSPILGPVLNGGPGMAAIRDTDGGRLDGDGGWDRAVGPMQFIPSTWKGYASDGNGDGESSPHNAFDAALASGKYLCSGGLNLRDPAQLATAVFRYNHSSAYVRQVLSWAAAYAAGVTPLQVDPVTGGTVDMSHLAAAPQPLPGLPPAQQPPPSQNPSQPGPSVPGTPAGPSDGGTTPPSSPPPNNGTTTTTTPKPSTTTTTPPSTTPPTTTTPPCPTAVPTTTAGATSTPAVPSGCPTPTTTPPTTTATTAAPSSTAANSESSTAGSKSVTGSTGATKSTKP